MMKQEMYDVVCAHLAQQRCRSLRQGDEYCAYRGKNGRMCAVGCLIPDDLYDPSIEGEVVYHSGIVGLLLDRIGVDVNFARRMQLAHDRDYFGPKGLRSTLRRAAREHGVIPGAELAITEWEGIHD